MTKELIEELRAERDAALAAVERVKEMHRPESNERFTWCVGCSTSEYPEDWPCETIQALDGAPEPEWEWGYAGETLVGVHNSISREAAEEDVANLRRYWNDERKFWVVRRTPASEWLPVEGESNG